MAELAFMLDTDTVSYALRGVGSVGERLRARRPSEICISALTVAELRYGVERRRSRKLRALVEAFAGAMLVAPFDIAAAAAFGSIAASLSKHGTPIGTMDTLIAAHAVALGLTLVTNNAKHFARVSGLATTSWI